MQMILATDNMFIKTNSATCSLSYLYKISLIVLYTKVVYFTENFYAQPQIFMCYYGKIAAIYSLILGPRA